MRKILVHVLYKNRFVAEEGGDGEEISDEKLGIVQRFLKDLKFF